MNLIYLLVVDGTTGGGLALILALVIVFFISKEVSDALSVL